MWYDDHDSYIKQLFSLLMLDTASKYACKCTIYIPEILIHVQ